METNAYLNPSDSPNGLVNVRRLNHIPLYVLGLVAFGVCALIAMVAFDKSKPAPANPADHGGNADQYAQLAAPERHGYISAYRAPTPWPVASPTLAPAAPVATPDLELESRKKAFYDALYAGSAVPDPLVSQREQAAAAQAAQTPISSPPIPPTDTDAARALPVAQDPNSLSTYAGAKDRWAINTRVEKPASRYVLQTGWVIPALLLSGMESELPGMIVAQTSQDVFDSPSGRFLLIPKGSRLVGTYANAISYGQSRIFVAWQRIIFPDGRTLDIGAMEGADGQGEAGFHDQVNNHFLRTFGSALLMSAITGGIALSQPNNNNNTSGSPNASSTLSSALGQQLGAATSSLLERNLSIPPTLRIRQGFKFSVVVTKDLVFPGVYHVPNY